MVGNEIQGELDSITGKTEREIRNKQETVLKRYLGAAAVPKRTKYRAATATK